MNYARTIAHTANCKLMGFIFPAISLVILSQCTEIYCTRMHVHTRSKCPLILDLFRVHTACKGLGMQRKVCKVPSVTQFDSAGIVSMKARKALGAFLLPSYHTRKGAIAAGSTLFVPESRHQ